MRVRREPRGHVRCGPQRELGDDTYVRVRRECVHHVGREAGAGRELLPALTDRVRREETRPLRAAEPLVEQGEGGIRPDAGTDVGGRQPTLERELHRAPVDTFGQGACLCTAEVRAIGEAHGDVVVRDGYQPVDQLGRQGRIGGEPAQKVMHTGILPGT